jgi:hypothetical protein
LYKRIKVINSIDTPPDFRVLWITKGIERKEGLRRLAREVGGPQEKAAGLFWFSNEGQSLGQPERVFAPIWQKAHNDTWRPLLGA